jgi:hypothetical protein
MNGMNNATLLFLHNGFLTISRQVSSQAGQPARHKQLPRQTTILSRLSATIRSKRIDLTGLSG